MTVESESDYCPICEGILSLDTNIVAGRCNEPSHWQAAGLLSASDYYAMAQIAARAAKGKRTSKGHN